MRPVEPTPNELTSATLRRSVRTPRMARISVRVTADDAREAVRAASPLEMVVPRYTGKPTRANGSEIKTTCPWHDDAHPTLRINPTKQVWRCDACDIGGDIFDFVRRYREISFFEAL